MNSPRRPKSALLLCGLLLLIANAPAQAGSATWRVNPTSDRWNTTANWTPATVPNAPTDVATFDVSNQASVVISGKGDTVDHITFTANASPYTITIGADIPGTESVLTISGLGIVNDSGITQNFVTSNFTTSSARGLVFFENGATAGDKTVFSITFNAPVLFFNDSSASTATFINAGFTSFNDVSTASSGTFVNKAGGIGGLTIFIGNSTADRGTFIAEGASLSPPFGSSGSVSFGGSATAGTGTFTLQRGTASRASGGLLFFSNDSTADHGTFTAEGGNIDDSQHCTIKFQDTATAGDAMITLEGGLQPKVDGATLQFFVSSSAGNSTLIANNGPGQESGGTITFWDDSTGGTSRIELLGPVGRGMLSISSHNPPGMTVGSIEGDGEVFLGARNLAVGTNNLSTTFSGLIDDGGFGGSLSKVGSGNLALTTANTYTGGTIISGGILIANNTEGSATGPGPVRVMAGTLGGSGTLAGPVLVGTGSSAGAILGPGNGTIPGTLTIQSKLTFKGDATYKVLIHSNTLAADEVVANGIKIRGASIQLADFGATALPSGTSFTVINNTAASAIAGTFSNLADGSTITVGPNTFQADYEGGDGNDLTLTVVP